MSNDALPVVDARGPIVSPGRIGHFDEHGVIPASVIERDGQVWLYYIGRTQGERAPMWYAAIGLAVSEDGGETFQRYSPAPIFSINRYDTCLVTAPHVMAHDGGYIMHYVSCSRWEEVNGQLASFYDIRRARSRDGLNWDPEGVPVIALASDEKNLARPWLLRDESRWQLWYSRSGDHPYRLGRAHSEDLAHWQRDDGIEIDFSGHDAFATTQCYASFFMHGDRRFMLVNGERFGRDGFAICELGEQGN